MSELLMRTGWIYIHGSGARRHGDAPWPRMNSQINQASKGWHSFAGSNCQGQSSRWRKRIEKSHVWRRSSCARVGMRRRVSFVLEWKAEIKSTAVERYNRVVALGKKKIVIKIIKICFICFDNSPVKFPFAADALPGWRQVPARWFHFLVRVAPGVAWFDYHAIRLSLGINLDWFW